MCTVLVEHKNNKKKGKFFVVPGNGQALLGMPDTDALNIIKINVHSIGDEDTRDNKWCANMHTVWGSNQGQETDRAEKCCTKNDSISKSTKNNTKPMVKAKLINQQNIALWVQTMIVTKGRELNQHSRYIKTSMMF